jgi:acyl dehydratase
MRGEPHTGISWTAQQVGDEYVTSARTITESDLIAFVAHAGYTEPLFLDARHGRPDGSQGRVVPALLTLGYADGLVLQTRMLHGTGIALLSFDLAVKAPVLLGDTIDVSVRIDEIRPTSDGLRAVVTTTNTVRNHHGEVVLVYRPKRLQR